MDKVNKLFALQKANDILTSLAKSQNFIQILDITKLVICDSDFVRENDLDRLYRKLFKNKLCALFGNKCAICFKEDNGLDLDHFLIPKIRGGSFILRLKNSYLVNNAVPLCQTCNRRKNARNAVQFYDTKVNKDIVLLNRHFTQIININYQNNKYKSLAKLLEGGQ